MPSRISQMRNGQQMPQRPQINEEYLNQLKTLMRSKNASQYLVEIASQNPQFKQFFEMAQKGTLRPVYENMARQRGIDPNWLISQLIN